jgi:transcriptional regulator with XRE-family HTH domain
MNVNDTNSTARALAAGVRRRRRQLGLTQRQLAAEMVAAGCREWTGATVANTERSDKPRALNVTEIGALCSALQCGLDVLLENSPAVLRRLRGWSPEAERDDEWAATAADARRTELLGDLEHRLAASLGIDAGNVARVTRAAQDLYGRDVLAERDSRLAGAVPGDPRDRAKRLGHATRDIRRELADYLAETDLGTPDAPGATS